MRLKGYLYDCFAGSCVLLVNFPTHQALMFRSGSQSPKKSILKKKSFAEDQDTIHSADYAMGGPPSPYLELMAPQERWRNTVHSMQQLLRKNGAGDMTGPDSRNSTWDFRHDNNTFTSMHSKKVMWCGAWALCFFIQDKKKKKKLSSTCIFNVQYNDIQKKPSTNQCFGSAQICIKKCLLDLDPDPGGKKA